VNQRNGDLRGGHRTQDMASKLENGEGQGGRDDFARWVPDTMLEDWDGLL